MPTRVELRFARPPMRLARPIVDGEGRLIAGTGTVLDDRVVRVLRTMAVQTVLVAGDQIDSWERVKSLAEELQDLDRRFASRPADAERGHGRGSTAARAELHAALARRLERRAARLAAAPDAVAGGSAEDRVPRADAAADARGPR